MPAESPAPAKSRAKPAPILGLSSSRILIAEAPAGADHAALQDSVPTAKGVQEIVITPDSVDRSRSLVVLLFDLEGNAESFLGHGNSALEHLRFPDANKVFLSGLPGGVKASDVETWIPERLVKRPGIVPSEDSEAFTSCSLLFPDPDTAARAIAHCSKNKPEWAASSHPLTFSYKDPDVSEPEVKVTTPIEPIADKSKARKRHPKEKKPEPVAPSRRQSTPSESNGSRAEAKARRPSERGPTSPQSDQIERQNALLDSLTDVMASLSTNNRGKKRGNRSKIMSAAQMVSPPSTPQHSQPQSPQSKTPPAEIWKPSSALLAAIQPPTEPVLSVEPVLQNLTLAKGSIESGTRLLRVMDSTSGLGLWAAGNVLQSALSAIREGDTIQLGTVRLDLLLWHIASPIVLGVEFVTFSSQPTQLIQTLAFGDAAAGDCAHGENPVALIVVPTALRWFSQIRAFHGDKLRFNVDLDQVLGEGAAWGLVIVEQAPQTPG